MSSSGSTSVVTIATSARKDLCARSDPAGRATYFQSNFPASDGGTEKICTFRGKPQQVSQPDVPCISSASVPRSPNHGQRWRGETLFYFQPWQLEKPRNGVTRNGGPTNVHTSLEAAAGRGKVTSIIFCTIMYIRTYVRIRNLSRALTLIEIQIHVTVAIPQSRRAPSDL